MSTVIRPCPDNAVLVIKGEHFQCDAMDSVTANSTNHNGWAHSSAAAEAIWTPAKDLPEVKP